MLRFRIEYDNDAPNPRKFFSPLGTIVCEDHSGRYASPGDEEVSDIVEWLFNEAEWLDARHANRLDRIHNPDDALKATLKVLDRHWIMLPVQYSPGRGACLGVTDWDSFNAVVYVSKADVYAEWSAARISPKIRGIVEAVLNSEIKESNAWITGEVFGYIIEDVEDEEQSEPGECIESCWGFFDETDCKEEAQRQLEYFRTRAHSVQDLGATLFI